MWQMTDDLLEQLEEVRRCSEALDSRTKLMVQKRMETLSDSWCMGECDGDALAQALSLLAVNVRTRIAHRENMEKDCGNMHALAIQVMRAAASQAAGNLPASDLRNISQTLFANDAGCKILESAGCFKGFRHQLQPFSTMDLAALREGIHQFSLKLQDLRGTVACPDFRALTLLEGPDVTTHLAKMKSEAAAALDVELLKCCLEKALQLPSVADMNFLGLELTGSLMQGLALPGMHDVDFVCLWSLGNSGIFYRAEAFAALSEAVRKCEQMMGFTNVREHQHLGKAEGFKLHCPCPSKDAHSPHGIWKVCDVDLMVGAKVTADVKLLVPENWYASLNIHKSCLVSRLPDTVKMAAVCLKLWKRSSLISLQDEAWDSMNRDASDMMPSSFVLTLMTAAVHEFLHATTTPTVQLLCAGVWQLLQESCSGMVPVVVYTHHIAERFLGLSPRGPLVTIEVRSKGLSVMDPLNMRSSSQLGHGCCEEVWQAMGFECRKELISAGFAVRSSMLPLNMQEWQAHIVELEEGLERSRADDAEAGYFVEPNIELIRTSQNDLPSTDTVLPDWSDEGIDGEDNSHNDSDNSDSDSDHGELVLRLIEQQKRRQDDLMQQSKREGVLMRALSNFVSTSEPTAVLVGDVIGLERVTRTHLEALKGENLSMLVVHMDTVTSHVAGHSEASLAKTFEMAKRRAPCVLVFPFFDGWIRDMKQSSHSVQLRSKFADLLLQLPHGLAVVASAVWPCELETKFSSLFGHVCLWCKSRFEKRWGSALEFHPGRVT